jgi:hypothetical protein
MKAWQKIVIGILIVVFVLLFGLGYVVFDTINKLKDKLQAFAKSEGFQTSTPAAPADPEDPNDPGVETLDEQGVFDLYEQNNLAAFYEGPPTTVEPYDSSTSLSDFDAGVPVPWDYDNKMSNPTDILWGSVDHRCSIYLWEAARLRVIFGSANNFEINNVGQLGYYSSMLNGMIIHNSLVISGVKYVEFFIDFSMEEVFETILGRIGTNTYGIRVLAASQARQGALKIAEAQVLQGLSSMGVNKKSWAEVLSMSSKDLKAAGISRTKVKELYTKTFNETFNYSYKNFMSGKDKLKATKFAEEALDKLGNDRRSLIARGTDKLASLAERGINKVCKSISNFFSKPAKETTQKLTTETLQRVGEKVAKSGMAAVSGIKAAALGSKAATIVAKGALFAAIPVVGQIIGWLFFLLSLLFISIIPAILADQTNLNENPEDANCEGENSWSGCPASHPFNLKCAVINNAGSIVWELIQAVPVVGDGMGAFGPYLCTASDLSTVFRQNFAPPDYYFDSSLSIYYTTKPKMLSGDQSKNQIGADPMYTDPGNFKLKLSDNFYHPWVDFSNTVMLDKMAQFYYDNSRKNQVIDIEGNATFQYIYSFKGLISSSQLSCDVQVELMELKHTPYKKKILSKRKLQNPVDTGEVVDTGCTFHDRRFYFTLDYKQVDPTGTIINILPSDSDTIITNKVNSYISRISSSERIIAYMRMFIVIGCTNTNGTAPNVCNSTPDGDYIGDAPLALGVTGEGYLPPITDTGVARNSVRTTSCEENSQYSLLRYGVNSMSTKAGSKNEHGIAVNVYTPDEIEFTEGLTGSDRTTLLSYLGPLPRYLDYFFNNNTSGGNNFNFVFNSEYSGTYNSTNLWTSNVNYLRDVLQILIVYYLNNPTVGFQDDIYTTRYKALTNPDGSLKDPNTRNQLRDILVSSPGILNKSDKYNSIMNIVRRNNFKDPFFELDPAFAAFNLENSDADGALMSLLYDKVRNDDSNDASASLIGFSGTAAVAKDETTNWFRILISVPDIATLNTNPVTTPAMSQNISNNYLYIVKSVKYVNISSDTTKVKWVKENDNLWPWPLDYTKTLAPGTQPAAEATPISNHSALPTTPTAGIVRNTIYTCSDEYAPYILRGLWKPVTTTTTDTIRGTEADYFTLRKTTAQIDHIYNVTSMNYIYIPNNTPPWTPYTGIKDPSIFVLNKSNLPSTETENIIYNVKNASQAFKYAQRWVPYRPMPVWQNNGAVGTSWEFNPVPGTIWPNSTKYWATTMIDRSSRQRWGTGVQSAILATGPLFLGFKGGLLTTSLDVSLPGLNNSISGAISCTYADMSLQTGSYTVNGYLKTSQPNFLIERGPAIQFAPGYKPTIEYTVNRKRLTRLECADRFPIRRMVKMYGNSRNDTRRIKRILGIEPRNFTCVYDVQDVEIDAKDGTLVEGSENILTLGINHNIDPTDETSSFMPSELTYNIPDATPLPYDDSINNPQITDASFNEITATNAYPGSKFKRSANCPDLTCGDINLQNTILEQFNVGNQTIPGDRTTTNPEMTGIIDYRTPNPDPFTGNKICYYKINYSVTKNMNVPRLTNQVYNLRVSLQPDTASACGYKILQHNFTKNLFYGPIPKGGTFIDLPIKPLAKGTTARTACTAEVIRNKYPGQTLDDATVINLSTSYRDCSGAELINRLVQQFNEKYTDHKILRVTKAFTPKLADNSTVCDYEVDMLRKSGALLPIIERDTLRIPIKEPAPNDSEKCLWDVDFAKMPYVPYRSGKTINKNSSINDLVAEYSWPMNYIGYVRGLINDQIKNIIPLDITGYMSTISNQGKMNLKNISNTMGSAQTIQGCPNITFQNKDVINQIINRYNYDGTPAYPSATNQFGVLQRSIVQVRRAGSGGQNICHMEVIEKEETFNNWLVVPDISLGDTNPAKYENTRFFMRKYLFNILPGSSIISNKCIISVKPMTQTDMEKKTFDISGYAYGIDSDNTIIQSPEGILTTPPKIDAINADVIDKIKNVFSAKYGRNSGKNTYYQLSEINGFVNVRPNIIEYNTLVNKTLVDPYFGLTAVPNVPAFVTATWNEATWNPNTGDFIYNPNNPGVVPLPDIEIFVPSEVVFKNDSDGNLQTTINDIVVIPPYSYIGYDPPATGYTTRGTTLTTANVIKLR